MNRFAAVSAVAAFALNAVLYAVDGVGFKQTVDAIGLHNGFVRPGVYIAQSYGYDTGYTSISEIFILNSAIYQLLILY
jgi:hypothetical protein